MVSEPKKLRGRPTKAAPSSRVTRRMTGTSTWSLPDSLIPRKRRRTDGRGASKESWRALTASEIRALAEREAAAQLEEAEKTSPQENEKRSEENAGDGASGNSAVAYLVVEAGTSSSSTSVRDVPVEVEPATSVVVNGVTETATAQNSGTGNVEFGTEEDLFAAAAAEFLDACPSSAADELAAVDGGDAKDASFACALRRRELADLTAANECLVEANNSYRARVLDLVSRCRFRVTEPEPGSGPSRRERLEEDVRRMTEAVRGPMGDVAADFFACQMRNSGASPSELTFTRGDLVFAFALYNQGPKCYNYLARFFSLPGMEEIFQWVESMEINPASAKHKAFFVERGLSFMLSGAAKSTSTSSAGTMTSPVKVKREAAAALPSPARVADADAPESIGIDDDRGAEVAGSEPPADDEDDDEGDDVDDVKPPLSVDVDDDDEAGDGDFDGNEPFVDTGGDAAGEVDVKPACELSVVDVDVG